MRILTFLFSLILLSTGSAFAHDPGLSGSTITLGTDHTDVVAAFSQVEVESLLKAEQTTLAQLADRVIRVEVDGQPLTPTESTAQTIKSNDVEFRVVLPAVVNGSLTIHVPLIDELGYGHRHFLTVNDVTGHPLNQTLLSASNHTASIRISEPTSEPGTESDAHAPSSFFGFLLLGIEHILTGWDHLLFLAVLLLVVRGYGDAFRIITCFTLAHSFTLALATFDLVTLPGWIVESIIAASIVYVALENIIRQGQPRGRWVLTIAFGLIHGLGFATVLRELGIGARGTGALGPLFAFNLGVELGQIVVASLVLPVLLRFRRNPVWTARWVPATSALIALMGAYWLVERLR